ncbi:MAG: hypothetical protein RBS46_17275, partial [Methyloversatilis sp.]|nr:hypothetical protein [Methyloversatilis sp.]
LRELFDNLDDKIQSVVTNSDAKNIKTVSQNQTYKFIFPSDLLNCENVFWSDGDHFSIEGEVRFGKRLPDNFLLF